jgi:hypothetical protein
LISKNGGTRITKRKVIRDDVRIGERRGWLCSSE